MTVVLVMPVLRQPRGQRRADHRIGKARRHAEEEGRDRRLFGIGPDRLPSNWCARPSLATVVLRSTPISPLDFDRRLAGSFGLWEGGACTFDGRSTVRHGHAPHAARPTPGQRALADALARGEAALGAGIETLAASVYTDPERYEAEQRAIFDRVPHLLAPSALLPGAQQAVAHDGYGTPLILTRDDEGQAHVFANVCRHRGTRLIDSVEAVPAKRIVCPYHAWAYKPDGELTGMPRADCFPGFDKAGHGLREFPCVEAGGLIWFAKEDGADFTDATGAGARPRRVRACRPVSLSPPHPRRRRQLEADHRRFP